MKVLELNNEIDEKEAFDIVNALNLDLRNTFSSFKKFKESEVDVTQGAKNLIKLMKEYTHPLFFHDYNVASIIQI